MPPLFWQSLKKIERAEKHIGEVNAIREWFFDGHSHTVTAQVHAQTRQENLHVEAHRLPADIALALGDAIHNLQSAFDLMAFDVVTRGGATPGKSLYFPFSKSRDDLVGMLKGGEIKAAGPAVLGVILDTIKPYQTPDGNADLYAMHLLDIDDKHKLLIPALAITKVKGIDAVDDNRNTVSGLSVEMVGGQEQAAIGFPAGSNLQITNHGHATGDVLFGPRTTLEGKAVVPTLYQLAQFVRGALNAISKTYCVVP